MAVTVSCLIGVLCTVIAADERKRQVRCQSQCTDSAADVVCDDDGDVSGSRTGDGRRCQHVDVKECTSQLRRLMRKKLVTMTIRGVHGNGNSHFHGIPIGMGVIIIIIIIMSLA